MPPRARTPKIACVERLIAFRVEVRVGLIKHDQERIAIERPRQGDALALARRKRGAPFADLCLVAVRQPQNELMDAGRVRRGDQRLRIGLRLEAGDVLRHRSGEQLDILRQVADVAAQRLRAPVFERGAVEPNLAARRRPHADNPAHQTRTCPRRSGR